LAQGRIGWIASTAGTLNSSVGRSHLTMEERSKPPRQETFRTAIVVCEILLIDVIAACKLDGGLLAWVLGGSVTGLAGYFVLDGVAKMRAKSKQVDQDRKRALTRQHPRLVAFEIEQM
jgi:hypothetical protein